MLHNACLDVNISSAWPPQKYEQLKCTHLFTWPTCLLCLQASLAGIPDLEHPPLFPLLSLLLKYIFVNLSDLRNLLFWDGCAADTCRVSYFFIANYKLDTRFEFHFCGALATNIRIGQKCPVVTNTLPYSYIREQDQGKPKWRTYGALII